MDARESLRETLAAPAREGMALAVSGGLDSRLLAWLLLGLRLPFTALHVRGPHVPPWESEGAVAWLAEHGVPFHVLDLDPLTLGPVRENARDRCYHCKRYLFAAMREKADSLGPPHLLDATNASDLGEYRPGLQALRELGVRSPLAELGIGKPDIRALAAQHGLSDPDQPSRACALTRFPYGHAIGRADLDLLLRAEYRVESLGVREFRLRLPAPGQVLLQLPRHAECGESLLDRLRNEIQNVYGIVPEIVFSERLSGFYDTQPDPAQSGPRRS
ncbi:hypothetical protein [Desulfohalovibrio reitneri]|uniref:hypothetical protein n=1 Tax=Desulfohalovibrio reitneri TaxID=1307759 RepID=UPI0006903421|nr:hypothetical protein [Desulfohalovibrio reitneri]